MTRPARSVKKPSRIHRLRYALYPGYVRSADGDRHWISAARLAQLYRVSLAECVCIDVSKPGISKELTSKLVPLVPLPDGNYGNGRVVNSRPSRAEKNRKRGK